MTTIDKQLDPSEEFTERHLAEIERGEFCPAEGFAMDYEWDLDEEEWGEEEWGDTCPDCDGVGDIEETCSECPTCNGSGYL